MNLRSAQAPAMYVGDHKHVCLSNGTQKPPRARSLSEPPQDVAFSSLFCFFVLSACSCGPEVTFTSDSPTPCVSLRGIFNTNQRSLYEFLGVTYENTLCVVRLGVSEIVWPHF